MRFINSIRALGKSSYQNILPVTRSYNTCCFDEEESKKKTA